jgi:putative transposase
MSMPNYRRFFVPGGCYFFTVVTHRRRPFLTDDLARNCLHTAITTVRKNHPFELPAMVLLPDHLHAIWTLPAGDLGYSTRWRRIKEEFTELFLEQGGIESTRSTSRVRRHERGIWQRRFWEHAIRDEQDLERHFDYIHYNPVKHRLVRYPSEWPRSSFHRWVEAGNYPLNWGCVANGPMLFDDLDQTAME